MLNNNKQCASEDEWNGMGWGEANGPQYGHSGLDCDSTRIECVGS
jgi:hypothetical protein